MEYNEWDEELRKSWDELQNVLNSSNAPPVPVGTPDNPMTADDLLNYPLEDLVFESGQSNVEQGNADQSGMQDAIKEVNIPLPVPEREPGTEPPRKYAKREYIPRYRNLVDEAQRNTMPLYNMKNLFRRVPDEAPPASNEALPADNVPWTDAEMEFLRSRINTPGPVAQHILPKLRKTKMSPVERTETDVSSKMKQLRDRYGDTYHQPWLLLTEKERSFIAEHCGTLGELGKLTLPHLRGNLKVMGIDTFDSLYRIVDFYKRGKKFPSISLEQSYDLREMQPLRLGTEYISHITKVGEKDQLRHIQVLEESDRVPVPWSFQEDLNLLTSAIMYGNNWESIKDPLYGRSIWSCQRRYHSLTIDRWTPEEISSLLRLMPTYNRGEISLEDLGQKFSKSPVECYVRLMFLQYGDAMMPLPSKETGEPGRVTRAGERQAFQSGIKSLYSREKPFVTVPHSAYDARFEEVPTDGLPWQDDELQILYENRKSEWSNEITRQIRSECHLPNFRSENLLKEKHQEMRQRYEIRRATFALPWNLFTEKETEIIRRAMAKRQGWKQALKDALPLLGDAGFTRIDSEVMRVVQNLNRGVLMEPNFITLEESYEARELYQKYPNQWGKIFNILNVNRGGKSQTLHTARGLIQHFQYSIGHCRQPVPWKEREDAELIRGVWQYYPSWDLIKEPLYGRSVRSCMKRYQELCLEQWTTPEDEKMRKLFTEKNGNIEAIQPLFPNKTVAMCMVHALVITGSDPDFANAYRGSPHVALMDPGEVDPYEEQEDEIQPAQQPTASQNLADAVQNITGGRRSQFGPSSRPGPSSRAGPSSYFNR